MDPGVTDRIEALKATIPETALEGLEADARALTPEGVLEMIAVAHDELPGVEAASI